MHPKKNDFILIMSLLAFFCILFVLMNLYINHQSESGILLVVLDGIEIDRISLEKDGVFRTFSGESNSNINEYKIENGKASMVFANCRDNLCVHMPSISKNGSMIVCLPHKLYLRIENKEKSEEDGVDAISD